jgi:hypothetical protein
LLPLPAEGGNEVYLFPDCKSKSKMFVIAGKRGRGEMIGFEVVGQFLVFQAEASLT